MTKNFYKGKCPTTGIRGDNPHYIYLLLSNECKNKDEQVYKIGKTKNLNRFITGYEKGFIMMYFCICLDCDEAEQKILDVFKQKFKPRKDYGCNFFEGYYPKMIELIHECIQNELNTVQFSDDES